MKFNEWNLDFAFFVALLFHLFVDHLKFFLLYCQFLIEKRCPLRIKQVGSRELQVAAPLFFRTPHHLLQSIVRAARIFHLNRVCLFIIFYELCFLGKFFFLSPLSIWVYFLGFQEELYFVGERDYGPFSPVNELESLNSIRISLKCLISSGKSDGKELLQLLEKEIRDMICSYVNYICVQYPDGNPENASMTPCMQSADARYLDKLLELGLAKPTDSKLRITSKFATRVLILRNISCLHDGSQSIF